MKQPFKRRPLIPLVIASVAPVLSTARAHAAEFCSRDTFTSSADVDLVASDPILPAPWKVDPAGTLAGSNRLKLGASCANAVALQDCFLEALRRYAAEAPAFRSWAQARGLDPAAILLAFSMQETRLGVSLTRAPESGSSGVGLLGVREWDSAAFGASETAGVYNALTGLRGALVALDRAASTLSKHDGLLELARAYARARPSSEREAYARSVVAHATRTLASCEGAKWRVPTADDVDGSLPPDVPSDSRPVNLLPVAPGEGAGERVLLRVPQGLTDARARVWSGGAWSEAVVLDGGALCAERADDTPLRLLLTGRLGGEAVHQEVAFGLVPGVTSLPRCAPRGGLQPLENYRDAGEAAAPAPSPLVANLKDGDAVGNGFELRFARGVDDVSVSLVYDGGGVLPLAEGIGSREGFCYAESRGAPTRTLRLRVEARDGKGQRYFQLLALAFQPATWAGGRCGKQEGAHVVSAQENASGRLLASPLNGQTVSNGVVFAPRKGVSGLRIQSPWKGQVYTIVDSLPQGQAACYVFTHRDRRELVITGKIGGTTVTEKLKITVASTATNDPRCPRKPGGLVFAPSFGGQKPDVKPIVVKPEPGDGDRGSTRDGAPGQVVAMPIPGSTVPNGVPFQFLRGMTGVRLWALDGQKKIELTSFPLDGNTQGLCYRFGSPGIRKFIAEAKDPSGATVSHKFSYEVTSQQVSINWCTDPTVPGGKVFDPRVARKDVLSVDGKSKAARDAIVKEALSWVGRSYRPGVSAMCAEFVRTVLAKACNGRFASSHARVLQAKAPYDFQHLGPGDALAPAFANSLAGEEIGRKVTRFEDLVPGDLVFKSDTYGNWHPDVITHVGIYVGNGQYVDRPTGGGTVLRRGVRDGSGKFASGTRVYTSWCTGPSGTIVD